MHLNFIHTSLMEICVPKIQFFDDATQVIRWVGLVIAVMALCRFAPGACKSIYRTVWPKLPLTNESIRGLGWTIMCLGTMPLSINFFNRVYGWEMSPWTTGVLGMLGPMLSTLGMTLGLIGATIKEYGQRMKCSIRCLALVYGSFIVVCGALGIVLMHI